jgi:hypothetical protein
MITPPFFDTNIRIGLLKFKMNWERIHDIKIVGYPLGSEYGLIVERNPYGDDIG